MICRFIVQPIVYVLQIVIEIVSIVKDLVCFVTQVLVTVAEWVYGWACGKKWWQKLICWLVIFLVFITKWVDKVVCEWVFTAVTTFLIFVLTYVIYVLKWTCAVLDFWLSAWLCLFEDSRHKCIRVCAVVAMDKNGTPILTTQQVTDLFKEASKIYAQCNVEFVLCRKTSVANSSPLTEVNVERLKDLFWKPILMNYYRNQACSCCDQLTIFFTANMNDEGWAAPGENWAIVKVYPNKYSGQTSDPDFLSDAQTIAHETGHLTLLMAHSNDPNNLMHASEDGTKITEKQCCRIRRSRFARRDCKCP